MNSDPYASPEFEEFAADVLAEMAPKLEASMASISLLPKGVGDVKYWVELGASIMMNKPIIVIAHPDTEVPPMLRKIARLVIKTPPEMLQEDEAAMAGLRATLDEIEKEQRR